MLEKNRARDRFFFRGVRRAAASPCTLETETILQIAEGVTHGGVDSCSQTEESLAEAEGEHRAPVELHETETETDAVEVHLALLPAAALLPSLGD